MSISSALAWVFVQLAGVSMAPLDSSIGLQPAPKFIVLFVFNLEHVLIQNRHAI